MMRSEEGVDQGFDLNAEVDSPIQCSICLESVEDHCARSKAKLQCGHEFHLDCIGSAFNMKGTMQCPNCRNVEKGQWLYANGSATMASDFSADSWIAEQYPFFVVPYGFRICPFRGLMEMEDPSNSGQAYYGHHDNSGGQVFPSSPGVAYFTNLRPHPHASLNLNDPFNGSHMTEGGHQSTLNLSAGGEHPLSSNQRWSCRELACRKVSRQRLFSRGSHQPQPPCLSGQGHGLSPSNPQTLLLAGCTEPGVGTGISSTLAVTHQNPDSSAYGPHPFNPHQRPIGVPLPFPPNTRRSNGSRPFPALIPAAQPYDPRGRFYFSPYPSTAYNLQAVPNTSQAWGRGLHSPMVPFRHR